MEKPVRDIYTLQLERLMSVTWKERRRIDFACLEQAVSVLYNKEQMRKENVPPTHSRELYRAVLSTRAVSYLSVGLSLRVIVYEDLANPSIFSNDQESEPNDFLLSSCFIAGSIDEDVKVTSAPSSGSSSGKNENVLPAYCNPPNPCPIGYTAAEDGCLEEFENTAAFSREYQAAQDCMCDSEHMFDCPASSLNNNSKSSKNHPTASMVDTALRKIISDFQNENPYLQGDKLPIAAKKGKHES
nr:EOG090X0DEG [Ilyocryptus agilis]